MSHFGAFVFLVLFFATSGSANASTDKLAMRTADGLTFDVMLSKAETPKGTVIYVTGLGGDGNQIQKLSAEFNSSSHV